MVNETSNYSIKAVLHSHPHFYDPGFLRNRPKMPGESIIRAFSPIPSLHQIVNNYIDNGFRIGVISACHSAQGDVDFRFEEHIYELKTLEANYDIDSHLSREGFVSLRRKCFSPLSSQPDLILIKSQEVRTKLNGGTADINFIGKPDQIGAGEDVFETIKSQREGRAVIVCHPNSKANALGLENTFSLLERGHVDSGEAFNASESPSVNAQSMQAFSYAGFKGVSVPDSHYYKHLPAWTSFEESLIDNFSIYKLSLALSRGNYNIHIGYIPRMDVHMTHTLPILAYHILRPSKLPNLLRQFKK